MILQATKACRKRLDADGKAGVRLKAIELLNSQVHLIEPVPACIERTRFAFGDFQCAHKSRHVLREIGGAHNGIPVREAS